MKILYYVPFVNGHTTDMDNSIICNNSGRKCSDSTLAKLPFYEFFSPP